MDCFLGVFMDQKLQPLETLKTQLSDPRTQIKLFRAGMYLFLALFVITVILVILSLTYADSVNPLNLFSMENRLASYVGHPLWLNLQTRGDSYLYADMIDTSSVMVEGRSVINIWPAGPIILNSTTGENQTITGHVTIVSGNGSDYIATIIPAEEMPEYYNNTHLYFGQSNLSFNHRGSNYNMILSTEPGSYAFYDNRFIPYDGAEPAYEFFHSLRLTDGNYMINQSGVLYPFEGTIMFTGTIDIFTPDSMYTYIPVNETQNLLSAEEITILNTDGSLVIGGKEYECHGADNLLIKSYDSEISAMLTQGKFYTMGRVDSVRFRDQEYASQPIKNFMRDGYFTIATGALTAILALFARQFITEVRRR